MLVATDWYQSVLYYVEIKRWQLFVCIGYVDIWMALPLFFDSQLVLMVIGSIMKGIATMSIKREWFDE